MIRPLYKAVEPFMEVNKGFGYLGVVQYDDVEDKIQCHICGKYFTTMSSHLKTHDTTAYQYKEDYGLKQGTPLAGARYLQKISENTDKCLGMFKGRKMFKHGKDWKRPGMSSAWIKDRNKKISHAKNTMSFKNRYGLCDLQIKARYEVVKKIVGCTPTTTDFKKHDYRLLTKALRKFHSMNNFRKWIGDNPIGKNERQTIPDIDLIVRLRKFYHENGRRPIASDITNNCTYVKHFGSWNNALNMAGLK
jgi:hypothetical protein